MKIICFITLFNCRPPKPITHLVANNNMLMMAMSDNTILRIDLDHPDQPDGMCFFVPVDRN